MQKTVSYAWENLQAIRKTSPLVHNITNYVVMNHTANVLLSVGASPVMAHAEEEIPEMIDLAQSLVLNIGTLSASWIESMHIALQKATEKDIPVVLDPVGAGATSYRTQTALSLLQRGSVTVIRGNASEIAALVRADSTTKGVDSLLSSDAVLAEAQALAKKYRCVVCVSGEIDLMTNGEQTIRCANGHAWMSRVTGMGCAASSVIGAFLAIDKDSLWQCTHAMGIFGIAGEIAAQKAEGPGSFQVALYDALFHLNEGDVVTKCRWEE